MATYFLQAALVPFMQYRVGNSSPFLSRFPYHNHPTVLSSSIRRSLPSLKPVFFSLSNGDEISDSNLDNSSETSSLREETQASIKDAEIREQANNTNADAASGKRFNFGILDRWFGEKEDKQLEEDLVFNGGEFEIRWRDILDPTPENILALLLTSVLGLAILQIFWQLFLVGITITLAGLKYSVIAVILLAFLIIFL